MNEYNKSSILEQILLPFSDIQKQFLFRTLTMHFYNYIIYLV